MKQKFEEVRFQSATLRLFDEIARLSELVAASGFKLTLRQLYLQLVKAKMVNYNQRGYDSLMALMSRGRLGGGIDWNALADPTAPVLHERPHWESVEHFMATVVDQFNVDTRADHAWYIELWCEKPSLADTVRVVCEQLDVGWATWQGYPSQASMYKLAHRLNGVGKPVALLCISDLDPSGIQMVEAIRANLDRFGANGVKVHRIGLTAKQARELELPSRRTSVDMQGWEAFVGEYGTDCYELEAMLPSQLGAVIREAVMAYTDMEKIKAACRIEDDGRHELVDLANSFINRDEGETDAVEND